MVTDEHVAAVRAIVALDTESHEGYVRAFSADGTLSRYELLFRAVFREAAHRYFPSEAPKSEVVRFVASIRKNLPTGAQDIGIEAAEQLLTIALEDPSPDLSMSAGQAALIGPLCIELIERMHLDDEQLDHLLEEARTQVHRHMGNDQDQ